MREPGFDFLRFENRRQPTAGTLLVANPFLPDNNFRRAVVLIAEHNPEGTVGFVVNKPVELRLTDVVPEFPTVDAALAYGGPVQLDTLHFIHTRGDVFDPCTEVAPGVFWGGDFATLRLNLELGLMQPTDVRFFVGYAGWGPGQLLEEIEENSWIVVPATPELVFESDPERLWRTVLRRMGGEYAVISNFPDDPQWN